MGMDVGREAARGWGVERSCGRAVIVMDADLKHPPERIPTMLERWRNGALIAEAVRRSRGGERLCYRTGAKVFYWLASRLSGFDLYGATDFKLLDRRAVMRLLELRERCLFFRGMTAWIGLPREAIEVDIPERRVGVSGWSPLKLVRLFFEGLSSYSSAPLQLVTIVGVIFLLFSLILGAQNLYNYLWRGAVTGFTTVILLQLITGSAVLLGLGVTGLYIATIYNEIKQRPYWIVIDSAGDSSDIKQ